MGFRHCVPYRLTTASSHWRASARYQRPWTAAATGCWYGDVTHIRVGSQTLTTTSSLFPLSCRTRINSQRRRPQKATRSPSTVRVSSFSTSSLRHAVDSLRLDSSAGAQRLRQSYNSLQLFILHCQMCWPILTHWISLVFSSGRCRLRIVQVQEWKDRQRSRRRSRRIPMVSSICTSLFLIYR